MLVGAGGPFVHEEAPTSLLPTTVAFTFTADKSRYEVKDACQEKASQCGPHEGKRLGTKIGVLAISVEIVAALYEDSTFIDC